MSSKVSLASVASETSIIKHESMDGPTPIRVHPKVVHWLIGRGLSNRLHVSIRRGKNNFDHFGGGVRPRHGSRCKLLKCSTACAGWHGVLLHHLFESA